MNTWTDSGLSEAGRIGAMLAIGVEARLPVGPARSGRGGSRRAEDRRATEDRRTAEDRRVAEDRRADVPLRSGRRRAAEPEFAPPVAAPAAQREPAAQRDSAAFGVPVPDYAGSYSGSNSGSGSHAAVEPSSAPAVPAMAASSLTGSFPMNGVAKLYTPEPVPLPSEPLPPEPAPPAPSAPPVSSSIPALVSVGSSVSSSRSNGDRDGLHSSTDGFLAGGFSSSSTDTSWDNGSSELPDLSGSWSRSEPHSSELSPAVSAPTSLLPMPKTPATHHAESISSGSISSESISSESTGSGRHSTWDAEKPADPNSSRETFNVESSTLGSLDSSGLFAALSRRG